MPRIGRKVIITGAAALIIATGSGVAAAAVMSGGPVDSSGVIHGCWSNRAIDGSHVFVMQDAGTSCPNGTTAISWNEQGSAGPVGPAGPTGPAGPAGTSGIDGGTVLLNDATGTCTVVHSFGPDAVKVSRVTNPNLNAPPTSYACSLSGLPANANVEATAVFSPEVNFGNLLANSYPADTVWLFPAPDGSTDVAFVDPQSGISGVSGEFNWIAVPPT
jgi:hypothetical protein